MMLVSLRVFYAAFPNDATGNRYSGRHVDVLTWFGIVARRYCLLWNKQRQQPGLDFMSAEINIIQ